MSLAATSVPDSAAAAPLIVFDRKHVVLLGLLVAVVGAGSLLRIHGSSVTCWHDWIDGSRHSEVLAGKARGIRSDEWLVVLSLSLAQLEHAPRFPVVNTHIGDGLNMLVPYSLPVCHPVTLVRPSVWGFFWSADVGLSWYWWSRIVGLYYVCFLVILLIGRNNFWIACLGSLCIVLSPMLQLWSFFVFAEPITYGGLGYLSLLWLLYSRSWQASIGAGLLLGWGASAFLFAIYPPAQVCMLYVFACLFLGTCLTRYREWRGCCSPQRVLLGLGIALTGTGLLCVSMAASAGDAIQAMRNTAYPGQRICAGGTAAVVRMLGGAYAPLFPRHPELVGVFGSNECEASSFVLFFPGLIILMAEEWLRGRKPPDGQALCLLACLGLFLVYMHLGLPTWLAQASLLGQTTEARARIGVGIIDQLLLCLWLVQRPVPGPGTSPRVIGLVAGVMASVVFLPVLHVSGAPSGRLLTAATAIALSMMALAAVLCRARAFVFLSALAVFLAASTLWVNPVVRGGTDYLRSNALATAMVQADADRSGHTRWLVFDDLVIQNLPRILGFASVNGVHTYPQKGLWAILDGTGKSARCYNRYAHVYFCQGRESVPLIQNPDCSIVSVDLPCDAGYLRALGATHVITSADRPPWPGTRLLATVPGMSKPGGRAIWEVLQSPAAE